MHNAYRCNKRWVFCQIQPYFQNSNATRRFLRQLNDFFVHKVIYVFARAVNFDKLQCTCRLKAKWEATPTLNRRAMTVRRFELFLWLDQPEDSCKASGNSPEKAIKSKHLMLGTFNQTDKWSKLVCFERTVKTILNGQLCNALSNIIKNQIASLLCLIIVFNSMPQIWRNGAYFLRRELWCWMTLQLMVCKCNYPSRLVPRFGWLGGFSSRDLFQSKLLHGRSQSHTLPPERQYFKISGNVRMTLDSALG